MLKLPRRRFLQIATGAAASLAIPRNASAQVFPSRPITVIVPTGAGGPQDVVARIVIDRMQGSLGQPLIVENVPGANGNLGVGRVARANRDGYTLSFSVSFSTHVVNPAIYSLPYDVVHDFEPVALVADAASVVLTKKAIPANDLKELIAWIKVNPDMASLGHTGPGSPAHVGGILLQKMTDTRFQFATYRSAGQAMQDLVGGHIDLMLVAPSIALEQVRSGNIKAYAVMGKERLAAAPNIPTVDEAGLPGFYTSPWYALWAPKGTPREVIGKLSGAALDALADAAVHKRLGDLGLTVFPRERQTPEALAAFHKTEIDKWWPILKEAGIKVE
jgi:tripartite-type tricarboxylate transporter receptor subunit TctC